MVFPPHAGPSDPGMMDCLVGVNEPCSANENFQQARTASCAATVHLHLYDEKLTGEKDFLYVSGSKSHQQLPKNNLYYNIKDTIR